MNNKTVLDVQSYGTFAFARKILKALRKDFIEVLQRQECFLLWCENYSNADISIRLCFWLMFDWKSGNGDLNSGSTYIVILFDVKYRLFK